MSLELSKVHVAWVRRTEWIYSLVCRTRILHLSHDTTTATADKRGRMARARGRGIKHRKRPEIRPSILGTPGRACADAG